ncbi:MAG: AAA family ATPase [Methanosphaera sp.]|nr:AAA family ATPase [Methanosphaera sp.]
MNISPLLKNNKPINTIIMGKTSTGKTTVIKQALIEIEENTNLSTCYINCNIQDTYRKIYLQLYRVIFGYTTERSVSTEIVEEKVMHELEDKSFVLVIDDINYLSKEDSNKLINELFRANEFYHSNIAIIITFNNILFKYSLERNAQSVLIGNEITFKDYDEDQLYDILKYRCQRGFRDNVITDEQIRIIAQFSARTDLRRGLSILSILGQKLDVENRSKITTDDLKEYILLPDYNI